MFAREVLTEESDLQVKESGKDAGNQVGFSSEGIIL